MIDLGHDVSTATINRYISTPFDDLGKLPVSFIQAVTDVTGLNLTDIEKTSKLIENFQKNYSL